MCQISQTSVSSSSFTSFPLSNWNWNGDLAHPLKIILTTQISKIRIHRIFSLLQCLLRSIILYRNVLHPYLCSNEIKREIQIKRTLNFQVAFILHIMILIKNQDQVRIRTEIYLNIFMRSLSLRENYIFETLSALSTFKYTGSFEGCHSKIIAIATRLFIQEVQKTISLHIMTFLSANMEEGIT